MKNQELNKVGINFKKLYEGRLEEIEIQIKKAIIYKKWHEKTKLEAEKEKLINYLNNIQ